MSQRAYLGGRPTLLDVAKGAVETFVKVGFSIQNSRIFFFFAVERYIFLFRLRHVFFGPSIDAGIVLINYLILLSINLFGLNYLFIFLF